MFVEKNAKFGKTAIFSEETLFELNSKRKDFVRKPRKTSLETAFSRKTFFFREKIDGLGTYSIVWRYIADTYGQQGGPR